MKYSALFLSLLFVLAGCSVNTTTEMITDEDTTPDIATIENVQSDMLAHHHMYDNMDRGNHDYSDKSLVVDPNINISDVSRGAVVLFSNQDGEKDLSRVIALPGEKVSIDKGQIYINDKKLDTFYGKAHRAGLDKENYFEKMDEEGIEYNQEEMMGIFELSVDEIKLSDREYYLIDDDWLRGKLTALNEDEIIGEVIGYSK